MTTQDVKKAWDRAFQFVADIRFIIAALGLAFGGGSIVLGDAGGADTARAIADSTTRAQLAPVVHQIKRQDTALIQINFRLEVMMTDEQRVRADSLMRKAMKNINYGGSP